MANVQRAEKGAIMVMAALSFTVLLLFAGMALDFGRIHLLKAQTQTAVDAAALAGALQVIPTVELAIDRWEGVQGQCTLPGDTAPYPCLTWIEATPVTLRGTEHELLVLGGWQSASSAACSWPFRCASSYDLTHFELILPANTTSVSADTFHVNAAWPGSTTVRVVDLKIETNPAKAEVTATAVLSMDATFLRLIGIRRLQFTKSGSAVPVRR